MYDKKDKDNDKEEKRKRVRGIRNIKSGCVFFQCKTCRNEFQEDPNQYNIKCPKCGGEAKRI